LKHMWTCEGARSTGAKWTRRKRLVVRHNRLVLHDAGLIDRRRSREAVSRGARFGPPPHGAAVVFDKASEMLESAV